MTTPLVIRPYNCHTDAEVVFRLWQACLEPLWPLTRELFDWVLTGHPAYREGDHCIAEWSGRVVGFAATQVRRGAPEPDPCGGIAVVLVHPEARRRGVGRALLEAALDYLRATGMRRAQLGAGGRYFWPGVPANLPEALAFFRACGWEYSETSYDLVQHLRGYRTPPGIGEPLSGHGIDLRVAREEEVAAILAFEAREFPGWADAFRGAAKAGDPDDLLVAWDAGAVVGSLILFTPRSRRLDSVALWRGLLGENLGGLGAVGVAEPARGGGIGTALVARGSEILQERGAGCSHIGWTWLLDFYGRLGYRPWREYRMSWREL